MAQVQETTNKHAIVPAYLAHLLLTYVDDTAFSILARLP